ncbi:Putative oxidoreductase YteT [Streptomyces sp. enrichment culture]|uniref:Gfo/Idh/MocA family protein n=1 Tax=Streptomyces sp. enrichment culture TaxID=1795815 RepID=UPI003F573050
MPTGSAPFPHPGPRQERGNSPLRYAVYGTGHRASMYIEAILHDFPDVARPVAWCDPNDTRMSHYTALARAAGHTPAHYHPDRLEAMLRRERVDVLIVCSPDHTHAAAVGTALRAGVDVVCEKPLTTDEAGLRAIREAGNASGARLTVTFNYRYSPRNSALKKVIAGGAVGKVLSVHFEWLLDTVHGADYFRRWHRRKAFSGGLAVHKATHHFDLVNWWLDDIPETVHALGGLRFYGDRGAGRPAGPRPSLGRDAAADDPYGFDMSGDAHLRGLYLDAEAEDGYLRDRDVFDRDIDIEDTLSVLVGYRGGCSMTYSLTAHSPWEGYRVSVNGSRGRAELEVVERAHVASGAASDLLAWRTDRPDGTPPTRASRPAVDPGVAPGSGGTTGARTEGSRLVVQRHWDIAREIPIEERGGGHGGGDDLLLVDVFRGPGEDPLRRRAGYEDGLRSVAVGVAVNESLRTGRPVRVHGTQADQG